MHVALAAACWAALQDQRLVVKAALMTYLLQLTAWALWLLGAL